MAECYVTGVLTQFLHRRISKRDFHHYAKPGQEVSSLIFRLISIGRDLLEIVKES